MRLSPLALFATTVFATGTALAAGAPQPPLRQAPLSKLEELQEHKSGADEGGRDKVIGGKLATPGQFKWQVALIRAKAPLSDPYYGQFCGGTLVGWRWVLTAAHCTFKNVGQALVAVNAETVAVYVGSINFIGGERIPVKAIYRHPLYNQRTYDNDVALLELIREPSDKSNLELVTLASDNRPYLALRATVIGWGSTAQGIVPIKQRKRTPVLQYAEELEFRDRQECNEQELLGQRRSMRSYWQEQGYSADEITSLTQQFYPANAQLVTGNMICAGGKGGSKDSCFGDSGGPLVVHSGGIKQVGIVSWGPLDGCGLTDQYGVYVNLSNYIPWISAIVAH